MFLPESIATLKVRNEVFLLTAGEGDADLQFERIYAFGARSFSVWEPCVTHSTASFTGPNAGPVWDSGDEFEQITASAYRANSNASNSNETRDDRSDNKGPEPEGITVGRVGPRDYAFIGLERMGTVMVYYFTNPRAPEFVQYLNTRRFGNEESQTLAVREIEPLQTRP